MLLTFLSLLYGVFLLGIAVSGAAIALGLGGDAGHAAVAGGAALAAGLAIGVSLALAARDGEPGEDAGRIARGAALLGASVRDALGFLRSGDARLLGAPRLVGVRRRRAVGDLQRARRAACARRARVRLLRRSGR